MKYYIKNNLLGKIYAKLSISDQQLEWHINDVLRNNQIKRK